MMSRYLKTTIKQDLRVPEINDGYNSNTYIRKIDGCLTYLNLKAGKMDKTFEYWGWHMATWTYFSYARDKKDRF